MLLVWISYKVNELVGGLLYHGIIDVVFFLYIISHSRILVSIFNKSLMIIVTTERKAKASY